MNEKVYSMLGLCMRAGKLAYGSDMCEEKINYKKVSLLIIAKDASDNTKEKFLKMCENNVPCIVFGEIEEISHSIGKNNKAVVAVMDNGFAKRISELIEESLKGAND